MFQPLFQIVLGSNLPQLKLTTKDIFLKIKNILKLMQTFKIDTEIETILQGMLVLKIKINANLQNRY
jgi:hypothetical protein